MDKIIELSDKIDQMKNINDKIKLIKNLNEMIDIEKNNLNYLLSSDIKKLKIKILPKHKKMTIDELEEEFENDIDINEKVSIYLAIDSYYTDNEEKLIEQ
jgi:hypothetical protein